MLVTADFIYYNHGLRTHYYRKEGSYAYINTQTSSERGQGVL